MKIAAYGERQILQIFTNLTINWTGVTLGSVTSYISAIVGAEQRFRPQQRIGSAYVAGVTLGSVTSYISA